MIITFVFVFFGQVMSHHHSDQMIEMSQRPHVSRSTLWWSMVKCMWLTENAQTALKQILIWTLYFQTTNVPFLLVVGGSGFPHCNILETGCTFINVLVLLTSSDIWSNLWLNNDFYTHFILIPLVNKYPSKNVATNIYMRIHNSCPAFLSSTIKKHTNRLASSSLAGWHRLWWIHCTVNWCAHEHCKRAYCIYTYMLNILYK